MFARLWSFITNLTGRQRFEDTLSEELHFHVDAYAHDLMQTGLSRQAAYRRARVHFGSVERVRDECRQASGLRWLDEVSQDLRHGIRCLRRFPAVTAVAVLTLALGIGMNSAIFSLVDALLLKPLPHHEPDRLAVVWEDLAAQGGLSQAEPTIVDVLSWQTHTEAFQDIGYFWASRPRLAVGDEVVQLQGVELSHNVLDLLGTAPALGRGFLPTETTVNGPRVAMLSHALWVSRFGGDRSVVGQTVMVNDTGHTVVGVLPKTFRFVHMPPVTERPDILTPFQRDPARCRGMSQCYRVSVVGRLADDVTLEHVQREIAQLAASGRTLVPGRTAAPAFRVMSLQEQTVAAFRPFAMALLGMVALVMLVACANVTNLLRARGEARRHELAVRGAIGATRRRLISQLLTEGLVLGVVGGMVGLVVAAIGTPLLIQRLSRVVDLPRQAAMTVDWRVVAFAMALSVVAGLITGLIPAVRMPSRAAALLGRRGAGWPHGGGVLHGLAVAQVAGAFILVVGAARLDAGVGSLLQTERGFRSDNVLAAQLHLTGPDSRERADNLAFVARLTDRIRGLPGVESVGATSSVPLDGVDGSVNTFAVLDSLGAHMRASRTRSGALGVPA